MKLNNNSTGLFKLEKVWDRKSSRIGFFFNTKHNSNCEVRIESQDGKHASEFHFSMDRKGRVELVHDNHSGHEYKCPKFVQKYVKVYHDNREESPRMRANIDSDAMGEDNDCTVKAIAIATGVSYEAAHKACALQGRVKGHGIPYFSILRALESIAPIAYQYRNHEHRIGGVKSIYVNATKDNTVKTIRRMAASVGAKRLTFNKLPQVVKKDKSYIVMNCGHAAAVIGGEIQDWSTGSKMLVTELIELK